MLRIIKLLMHWVPIFCYHNTVSSRDIWKKTWCLVIDSNLHIIRTWMQMVREIKQWIRSSYFKTSDCFWLHEKAFFIQIHTSTKQHVLNWSYDSVMYYDCFNSRSTLKTGHFIYSEESFWKIWIYFTCIFL